MCTESGDSIKFGEPLYSGLRRDGEFFCALSRAVVDMVPDDLRRPEPCAAPEDGLDIHEASAGGPTLRGAYEWTSLRKGKFLFSVSRDTAAHLLPKTWCESGADTAARVTPGLVLDITLVMAGPPPRRQP